MPFYEKPQYKSVMHDEVNVGDVIICHGKYVAVRDIVVHSPGTHKKSPIKNDWVAVEYVTETGSRWKGIHTPNADIGSDK